MSSRIDLHIHTESSRDGNRSAAFILNECRNKNISTIAITDHNSTAAVEDALKLQNEYGVEVIPGIEIDTVFGESIFHLLGYYIDYRSPDFNELYKTAARAELDVFPEMVARLNEMGILISWEAVLEQAGEAMPTEAMISQIAVSNPSNHSNKLILPFLKGGERSSMPEFNFYFDFLAPGKPAFILRDYIKLESAVDLILENGGVPILAHPGSNLKKSDALLPGILKSGIRGIESFSSYHDTETNNYFTSLSQENNLLITCGSDFHGSFKPAIILGGHGCTINQDEILKNLKRAGNL